MRVRIGLFFCLLPLAPRFAQSGGRAARSEAQRPGVVSKRRVPPDEFFAHPEELCKALNSVGIETGDWDQIGISTRPTGGPFMCEYHHSALHSDHAAGSDTRTLFRVSGDTGSRADVISIAVTLWTPAVRPIAQQEFSRLVAALFQSIDKPEPPGLLRSIARRRYYLARRPYGIVWFNFVTPDQPGYQRVFWFRLSE